MGKYFLILSFLIAAMDAAAGPAGPVQERPSLDATDMLTASFYDEWSPGDTAQPIHVLFIGDSHTAGSFGAELDLKLRTLADAVVDSYGSCGSRFRHWLNGAPTTCGYFEHVRERKPYYVTKKATPRLSAIVPQHPDQYSRRITVIELGTNSLGWDYGKEKENLLAMLKILRNNDSECILVGPPKMRKVSAKESDWIYALLREAEGCQLIDSTKFTEYPATGGDGYHYDSFKGGRQKAAAWADLVFEEIARLMRR